MELFFRILTKFFLFGYKLVFTLYALLLTFYRDLVHVALHLKFEKEPKTVLIIGGGFAGAYAAKKLEGHFKVILVDSKDYFEFTPSVLRTIIEPNHIEHIQMQHHNYLDMKKVTVVTGTVTSLNSKNVVLQDNTELSFDYAMVCVGSYYNLPFKEMNVLIASRGTTLSRSYRLLSESQKILIIGGGIVGVELAAEIIEKFPNKSIKIVHGGSTLMNRNSVAKKGIEYCTKFLESRGVELHLNERVTKKDESTNKFSESFGNLRTNIFFTDKGNKVESDLTFVCSGVKPNSDFMKDGPLKSAIDPTGFISVNEFLQVKGFPNIFAAGDCCALKEEKLAQNAEANAHIAIENLFNYHHSKKMKPYTLNNNVPKVISLGKYDGVFVLGEFALCGYITSLMKEFVEHMVMTNYRYLAGRLVCY